MVNLWEHIEKDIERTRKEMNFFSLSANQKFDDSLVWLSKSKAKNKERMESGYMQNHRDVLTRLLFVFGRTNIAVGYAQGMNEIAAILYYCFYTQGDPLDREHAEADTFWCFFNLVVSVVLKIIKFREHFIFSMTLANHPLKNTLETFEKNFNAVLPQVKHKLDELQIKPEFYAYRWFLLFYTQEYDIAQLLRLWDSLLCFFNADSRSTLINFMYYFALAILSLLRKQIIGGDLNSVMQLLQKHKTDINQVIAECERIFKALNKKSILEMIKYSDS